ncbi:hypothetical protein GCM10012290_21140 [Halolactibacillus alkaliphilus]|uniref:O-antigen ligase-related domain-containing protein n=1 Tax=Halolactibacillus alkaliphilus TaxID=442899 RepID=A0A511X467_9BACI|nr:O-antigen ligase family protein [Halolactibacillus alkaliphilus]GEN57737.1 hypothetical protein HAL01_22010 [Halolactibacillus alkaliphilus]GGN73855.1 hypothetical protein GCM10012290_21140 [Halolactibacillus alkaliphilus]SFO98988.1 O-Antigen ligase [Halolactibacillus alkaliphilus]
MKGLYFWFLTCLLFSSLFNQGLYFDASFYPYHIIIQLLFMIFLVRIWLYKEHAITSYFIFLLIPLTYLIPLLFQPSSVALTLQSFMRASTTINFFIMVVYVLTDNLKSQRVLPYLLHGIGLILSGHMILFDLGILTNGEFIMMGRYAGLLEYANTFAVVLASLYLYGLIQGQVAKTTHMKLVHAALLPLYMLSILKSQSRGVLLFLVIFYIVLLLMLEVKKQLRLVIVTITSLLLAIVLFVLMGEFNSGLFIGLVSICAALSSATGIYITKFHFKGINISRLVVPTVMIVALAVIIFNLLQRGTLYTILDTVFDFDMAKLTGWHTFKERVAFIKDGLNIVRDAPLVGQGGRAWALNYEAVKSYDYHSLEVHNAYLDILIETGLVGLTITLVLFGLLAKQLMGHKREKIMHVLPVLLILCHSVMDFNLSYGFVWFFMSFMVGGYLKGENELLSLGARSDKWRLMINVILMTLAFGFSLLTLILVNL